MPYVEVVVGLPIEGPFDYYVPETLEEKIAIGKRVLVPFRNQKKVGYIVEIKEYSSIKKKIKPIYNIIDDVVLLDHNLLRLSRLLSKYYYCSWGEAIELILPKGLRKGKKVELKCQREDSSIKNKKKSILLIHDLLGGERWRIYIEKIEEKLNQRQAVIFLVPQAHQIEEVIKKLKQKFREEIVTYHSKQKDSINLLNWQRVKNDEVMIAVGTRMAVFLPFSDLGLIIIDDENSPSYKEEQSPYYHTRTVAFLRSELENTEIILSDINPSLESLNMVKKKKINYMSLEKKDFPLVTVVDIKREGVYRKSGVIFSSPLVQLLEDSLKNREKVLIFLNKKGFSTFIYCPRCRKVLKCPRCDINLTYYFKDKILICHYCNYKMPPARICPDCASSYIRYSGIGTEKLESKLSLFLPQARILRYEKQKEIPLENVDFLISTEAIFTKKIDNIDSIVVLSLDNILNRIDFRAAEYTFSILLKLLSFDSKRLLIQTEIPQHYCFEAIKNKDINIFYNKEMLLRKQLGLPPATHIAFIRLRGKKMERVKAKTELLFKKLKRLNKSKSIKVVSCFAHTPQKMRDNYIWQIMLKSDYPEELNLFLKKILRKVSFSDIIISVDID